jgi:hypothetical protein
MRRFTPILMLLLATLLFSAVPARAWLFGGSDTLVTIDGTRYSATDFKRWWQFWNDEKLPLPQTPDVYVDWLLLAREGERMDLASTPGFQRMAEVFLKSRSLLMLKNEEINSRIKVTEADIRALYEKEYLPRWLVQRLEFRDEAAAGAAWQELTTGAVSVDELAARDPEQGGPVVNRESWLRPNGIDPWWKAIFEKLEPGEMVEPGEGDQAVRIFYLKERKGGDDEDLDMLREGISRKLWKQQENELTLALLDRLREKYQVKVDNERIEAIDLTAAETEASLGDTPVITTSKQNVSEKDFLTITRRYVASRGVAAHSLLKADEVKKLKDEIVNGIIAQHVTDWEALDRHYEEQEPFKWEYEFYVNHQMGLGLEKMLFGPAATVTDEEIKRHYEENLGRYTQMETARIIIVDDTQGPVNQVWADVISGTPFTKAVRQRFGHSVESQEVPVNHLDPDIKAAVAKLAVGETSPPLEAQESQVLVHLLDRTPPIPFPLERVVENIRNHLIREKIDQQRREYLETIKSRSRIKVRSRQWNAILKELGGAK